MSLDLFRESENHPGFLVTIDGPNGSGKTILTEELASELRRNGQAVHSTRQPSPTPLGDFVRGAEMELRGRALACLVAADRHHQIVTEIAAHLGAGEIVICDRYVESSLVLQRLDGVDTDFIISINSGIPRPDLRIRLLADPEVLRARLSARTPEKGRRFEATGSPERELGLYAEAENLLATRYGLPATIHDTSHTDAEQLGAEAADLVMARLRDASSDRPRDIDPERM